jgi:ABC-2 type transport system ATP-binding protein
LGYHLIMNRDDASPDPMIHVEDLVKRYPKRPVNAVDGVTFSVPRGEVFGLLGPNGAGKTTTIGVLTTRVIPTGGKAEIAGVDVARDPVRVKRHLAVVPQRNNLDRQISARNNLIFHAAYFGMSKRERERRADNLLGQLGLGDRGKDKVDNYSGGMAQRLMIARALMHDPDVLFLDEPTTGLDPQARLFVWDRVRDFHEQGLTVFLTTHDMDEAETLCGRVAIMDHGKILALDTPQELKRLIPGSQALELHVRFESAAQNGRALDALAKDLEALPGVERVERVDTDPPSVGAAQPVPSSTWGPGNLIDIQNEVMDGGHIIRVYTSADAPLIAPASQLVARHNGELSDLHVARASLEDVFIHLTGRGLR